MFETGSCCVAQAGPELVILLPQPPECSAWITGIHHLTQLGIGFVEEEALLCLYCDLAIYKNSFCTVNVQIKRAVLV
jgi:hypothetical protein